MMEVPGSHKHRWCVGMMLCALLWWGLSAESSCQSPTPSPDGGEQTGERPPPLSFRAITMNVGTNWNLLQRGQPQSQRAYDMDTAEKARVHYRNRLAWPPAEEAARTFLAEQKPALVALHSVFYDPDCKDIPKEAHTGFVCESYQPGQKLQVQRLLGEGYQIACAQKHPYACLGVRKDFGRIDGCDQDICLDQGRGTSPAICFEGVRGEIHDITTTDGHKLVLVAFDATPTVGLAEQRCREAEFEQIFLRRKDRRTPDVEGTTLILGSLKADPFLQRQTDVSAAYMSGFVGPTRPFRYLSSGAQQSGPGTVAPSIGFTNLRYDHVLTNTPSGITGSCDVPGSQNRMRDLVDFFDKVYWDHWPVICDLIWQP